MKLYVMRHPEPIGADGLCYGQTDLDVTEEALRKTTLYLQTLLVDKTLDLLLTSPLTRCQKLAVELGAALQVDPVIDNRLIEMSFGIWEGLRWEEIDAQAFDEWSADYVNIEAPGGESFGAVLLRVENLLEELKQTDVEAVALVAHAGVIRALLSAVLDIPLVSTWQFGINYGTLLELSIGTEQWQNRLLSMTVGS
ncbi:MAG: alpha-ribazole phosphatase family protein [Coriobacteriia bacterium]|nr:alpha-ribazole phosphatase family protein [Coriobacteriia bacterium]